MENHGDGVGVVSETKSSYDVFLSFRGEDTRRTFTRGLYQALDRKGINTFMDNEELKVGNQIGPTLLKAIEESRISIVVFSQNYASSSWCLDELVKIHECMKSKKQLVWPIFYKVQPSEVRHQNGSYGKAMTEHERKFGKDSEKVKKWRSTLTDLASLKGEHLEEGRDIDESVFIDDLVGKIFNNVSPKDLCSDEHIVGRKYLVEQLKSLLDLKSRNVTCMFGIHGTGGIGKTTLAKALYDSIYKQFEGSSFLFNVREASDQTNSSLENLQQMLLTDLLEDRYILVKSKIDGANKIKSRLRLKRVLIVLDDVDNIRQLKNLAGGCDWFGCGSRIIITTRDTHLLDLCRVEKRYEVKGLNEQESLELFCQSAFGKSCPETDYEYLSNRAVRCCNGLPLALKIIGSHMVGKDLDGWKNAIDRYEKSSPEDVLNALRISYDSLPFNEKNIFLDIACFFEGWELEYVKGVLDACDFDSSDGISTLVNKSLLTIDHNRLRMHDHIQAMGRKIIKEEAKNKVSGYSRLWHHEDVLQILANNNGSSRIQGIMLDPPEREEINCIGNVFMKMENLRILIVRNTSFSNPPYHLPNNLRLLDWVNCPSQSLPSSFNPKKIWAFNLPGSPLLVLEKPFERFEHLTCMDISDCDMVTKFPDVSGAMNLRELSLHGCKNLISIHQSVGYLPNLVSLKASQCSQLQSFVPTMYLPSLENFCISLCTKLTHFPEIRETMGRPLKIIMSNTFIKQLPKSIEKLIGLNHLDMTCCGRLEHLPSSMFMLPNFVTLKIGECHGLRFTRFERSPSTCPKLETLHFYHADLSDEDVHTIVYNFPNLKDLNLSWNNLASLPTCITESTNLRSLDVSYCKKFREIPELPSSVEKVDAMLCNSLTFETSNVLWSQVLKEKKRLEVVMRKSEIPEWFDYVKEGGFPVFQARGNFPAVALAFVFGTVEGAEPSSAGMSAVGMHLFIDGKHIQYHKRTVAQNHALLSDLRSLFSLEDLDVGNDWKTIQVYCNTELSVCSWGVYVYKLETKMQDIRFRSQDLSSSSVRRLHEISKEEEERNKKQSSNVSDMYRTLHMMMRSLDESGYFLDKPDELLKTSQMFLRVLRNSRDGGRLNIIKDEKVKFVEIEESFKEFVRKDLNPSNPQPRPQTAHPPTWSQQLSHLWQFFCVCVFLSFSLNIAYQYCQLYGNCSVLFGLY
ncbi:hypothetical protein Fmac_022564 [Flemingia macrophylla]|uniref:TIR domain-containing protein n=1 Tax=Flemingia macrophylla TaxID=520843 RepID=A0ABD1M025_9FABA